MEKNCQCSDNSVNKCTKCYCSNCFKSKLQEDYGLILIDEHFYCLQCSYDKIKKLMWPHGTPSSSLQKNSLTSIHGIKKRERRYSWHGTLQQSNFIDDTYFLEDISEETRATIHKLFLKKADEFLVFLTVGLEKILSFKNKISEKFLSSDVTNAYDYFIKFICVSLSTFNLWYDEIKEVDKIIRKRTNVAHDKSSNKKIKFNLSLKKTEDDKKNDTENIDDAPGPVKDNNEIDTNVKEITTGNNVYEDDSNDSVYSHKTEDLFDDLMDDGIKRETVTNFENLDKVNSLENEIDYHLEDTTASNESEKSFVFDINSSYTIQPELPNLIDDEMLTEEMLTEEIICSPENKYKDPLLGKKNVDIQKMNFLKSLDLTCRDTDEDRSEEKMREEEYDMEHLLQNIEDEPFIMSDEDSVCDDVEDQDSYRYIELSEGIYGKITNTLPSLPLFNDLSNDDTNKTCYDSYNLKECSVVLEKVDESTLTYNNPILNSILDKTEEDKSLRKLDEIERLLNLTDLEKKRKHTTVPQGTKTKKLKTNLSEPVSDISDVDLESDADCDENVNLLNLLENADPSINDNLSETDVLENLLMRLNDDKDDSTQEESESTSESDDISKDKKISDTDLDKKENNKENQPKQELPPKSINVNTNSDWMKDPLLRCSLQEKPEKTLNNAFTLDVNDKSIPEYIKDRISKLEARMLNNVTTVECDVENKEKPCTLNKNPATTNFEDISDEDIQAKYNEIIVGSESDSDIEFVSVEKHAKKKKSNNEASELDNKSITPEDPETKKGRRNIRAILDYRTLTQETKEANLLEKKRKNRLNQKHKDMDAILSLSQYSEEDDGIVLDIDDVTKTPNIVIHPILSRKLKAHQKTGVKFMWESCYEGVKQIKSGYPGSGCILAHCMGLGKTLQVIALIHTLFNHEVTNTKHVLILCPLSLVFHWKREFREALKDIEDNSCKIFSMSERSKERFLIINEWQKSSGVLILGYECYHSLITPKNPDNITLQESSIKKAVSNPGPDLIVLDEGHLIKNKHSVRSKSLRNLKTKRRIVLTGTPLQNNLMEYYYMIQFVKPNLLGSFHEYQNRFSNPITNGQYYDSTNEDIIRMKKRSHVLNKLLKGTVQRYELSELVPYLKKRHDYALFIQLHPLQMNLYEKEAELARGISTETTSAKEVLSNYHKFKFIWSHPYMFHLKETETRQNDKGNLSLYTNYWWKGFCPPDSDVNINYGPKFKVMYNIVQECTKVGDKVLVFSNCLLELSTIEHFLKLYSNTDCQWVRNKDYLRMDGSTSIEKRVQFCDSFNDKKNSRTRLFLISNKVGGMGLNLIGANRVILMDVNWNPAQDNQSVFRIYRFGQEKECFIYRLVSMGTMEEVVYDRQVTKLAIAGRVIDSLQITRHYKSNDLQVFYRPKFNREQIRPTPPLPADCLLAKVLQSCPEIFRYHEHQSLLENLPDENLNEDEMKLAWDEFNKENERENELEIKKQTLLNAATCQSVAGNPSNVPSSNLVTFLPSTLVNNTGTSTRYDQQVFELRKSIINTTNLLKKSALKTNAPKRKSNEDYSRNVLETNKSYFNKIEAPSNAKPSPEKAELSKDNMLIPYFFKSKPKYKMINPLAVKNTLPNKSNNVPVINLDLTSDDNSKKLVNRSIGTSSKVQNVLQRPKSSATLPSSVRTDTIINLDDINEGNLLIKEKPAPITDNTKSEVKNKNAGECSTVQKIVEQTKLNSTLPLSNTTNPIINLDEINDDTLLMKEQQALITTLNENLDITLSALEKNKSSKDDNPQMQIDVIEIDD